MVHVRLLIVWILFFFVGDCDTTATVIGPRGAVIEYLGGKLLLGKLLVDAFQYHPMKTFQTKGPLCCQYKKGRSIQKLWILFFLRFLERAVVVAIAKYHPRFL